MNQRIAILFLCAAGASGCGSAGASGTDDERLLTLHDQAACVELGGFSTPAITKVTGPLTSSVPRTAVPTAGGIWFSDSQDVTLSHLGEEDGLLRRFSVPFPSESVFDIAVGADQNLWFDIVTADLVASLGRMTPEGETAVFAIPSGNPALRVTAGPGDAVWFTTTAGIGRVSMDGTVAELPVGATPLDLTAGPDDALWFTEPADNRIGRLTPDGTVTHFDVPSADSGLSAIVAGPDGAVWFSETNSGKIGRIDALGAIVEFDAVAPPASPGELAVGPDGRIWFTIDTGDFHATRVGSISPCGTVALVDLPALSDSVDFQPPVDVPAVPYGIAGGDDEIWVTVTLEPFETGAVLRLGLDSAR